MVTRLSSELYSLQGYHTPFVAFQTLASLGPAAESSSTKAVRKASTKAVPSKKKRKAAEMTAGDDVDTSDLDDEDSYDVSTTGRTGKTAAAGTGYSGSGTEDVSRPGELW